MCLEDTLMPSNMLIGIDWTDQGTQLPLHVCVCVHGPGGSHQGQRVSGQSGAGGGKELRGSRSCSRGCQVRASGVDWGLQTLEAVCAEPVLLRVWKPRRDRRGRWSVLSIPQPRASVTQSPVSDLQSALT